MLSNINASFRFLTPTTVQPCVKGRRDLAGLLFHYFVCCNVYPLFTFLRITGRSTIDQLQYCSHLYANRDLQLSWSPEKQNNRWRSETSVIFHRKQWRQSIMNALKAREAHFWMSVSTVADKQATRSGKINNITLKFSLFSSKEAYFRNLVLNVKFELSKDNFCNTLLTLRRLMSYIYGAPILDVSRSHTTTQHSR